VLDSHRQERQQREQHSAYERGSSQAGGRRDNYSRAGDRYGERAGDSRGSEQQAYRGRERERPAAGYASPDRSYRR
jgi:hypothetical protein